jgi:hypothetical protein
MCFQAVFVPHCGALGEARVAQQLFHPYFCTVASSLAYVATGRVCASMRRPLAWGVCVLPSYALGHAVPQVSRCSCQLNPGLCNPQKECWQAALVPHCDASGEVRVAQQLFHLYSCTVAGSLAYATGRVCASMRRPLAWGVCVLPSYALGHAVPQVSRCSVWLLLSTCQAGAVQAPKDCCQAAFVPHCGAPGEV